MPGLKREGSFILEPQNSNALEERGHARVIEVSDVWKSQDNIPNTPPTLKYPAVYLYPLNNSFLTTKFLYLRRGIHIKIGRQINPRTFETAHNGFFRSQVLSRTHAELWEENGKIYIMDVKSANGTFINGQRLSKENLASEPFELKSGDVIDFGVDISGNDDKTIIHHKVSSCVTCITSEKQAEDAERMKLDQQLDSEESCFVDMIIPGLQVSNSLQQGLLARGSGTISQLKKTGITFDHILRCQQVQSDTSKKDGVQLGSRNNTINGILENFNRKLPTNWLIPLLISSPTQPFHNETIPGLSYSPADDLSVTTATTLFDLQAQIQHTQYFLAQQVEKAHVLENAIAEHALLKHEVKALQKLIDSMGLDVSPSFLETRGDVNKPGVADVPQIILQLSTQLDKATVRLSTLAVQHSEDCLKIQALETKIESLLQSARDLIQQCQAKHVPPALTAPNEIKKCEVLSKMMGSSLTRQWNAMQKEWAWERVQLQLAEEEQDNKIQKIFSVLDRLVDD